MVRAILFRLTGTVERFVEYILEQSVLLRAVPELIVGEAAAIPGGGVGGCQFFRQSFSPVLHTSGQNGDKASPNITLAGHGHLMKMLINS